MEFMIYEKKGSIAQITINRPKALNAFNSQMLDELTEALALAEQDPEIRCVILTAAGERAFTAGGDIKEEVQLNEETAKAFSRRGKGIILSFDVFSFLFCFKVNLHLKFSIYNSTLLFYRLYQVNIFQYVLKYC